MIVKWPGVVKANTTNETPVIIEDFFPSILQMADIQNADIKQKIDGQSFVPALKGDKMNGNRSLIWYYPHRWLSQEGPGINYFSAIRKGKWKLIYNLKKQELELYDLSKDIGEHNNLALKNKKVTKKLASSLTENLKKWDVKLPIFKEGGFAAAWPEDLL